MGPVTGTDPFPRQLAPMLAKLVTGLPRAERDYGYEFKWDGIRALTYWDGHRLRIETRNHNDVTARYPELHPLAAALGSRTAVLDGEIVALDDAGRPRFERLQQRLGLTNDRQVAQAVVSVPAFLLLFDVLYWEGRSRLATPYADRRALLTAMELNGANWQTPPAQLGEGGDATLIAARTLGLEGVVAKKLGSHYVQGARTSAWQKVKLLNRDEFVVGGWTPGTGGRGASLGALLIGRYDRDRQLVYEGRVGTGFTDKELDRLSTLLRARERPTSPFARHTEKHAHWVEPELVVEVEYLEHTSQGILRAPSYKGVRTDKAPVDVVRADG